MKSISFRCTSCVLAVVVALALAGIAHACNVPVFRFALERWRPDPYRVIVFHHGKLNDADRELIRPLEDHQDNMRANLAVFTVDLADESAKSEQIDADRAIYDAIGKPSLPWVVVQYPAHLRITKPAWAGPLKREVISAAIDSPIRRELAKRLAEGQTAVYLLLESGDAAQDDAAATLVEGQLKHLEQDLKLPELTDSPDDALATTLPLAIKFSVIRVPRNVSAEHGLVAMLVGSEPDLAERSDPMVFPVFGRGRALLPLIGPGITAQNIHDAAGFLAGPCSCEVKEQNPGFDLMLAVNWEDLLADHGLALTAIETRSAPANAEPELVPIPSGAPPVVAAATAPPPNPTPSEALRNSVTGAVVSTPLLIVGSMFIAAVLVFGIFVAVGPRRGA